MKQLARAFVFGISLCVLGTAYPTLAQTTAKSTNDHGSDRAALIGAWHLVSIGEAGQDGRPSGATDIKGTLIYTQDGHMSVQLMYPTSAAGLLNDYVLNGYEASFGTYDVDAATHTVTHHVEGSVTRGLVGKNLPRVYKVSGNQLIIRSTSPEEHWSVLWEHD